MVWMVKNDNDIFVTQLHFKRFFKSVQFIFTIVMADPNLVQIQSNQPKEVQSDIQSDLDAITHNPDQSSS